MELRAHSLVGGGCDFHNAKGDAQKHKKWTLYIAEKSKRQIFFFNGFGHMCLFGPVLTLAAMLILNGNINTV